MVNAIVRELHLQKDFLQGEEIKTIYFGGGTPSLLTGKELNIILDTINHLHPVYSNAEITLEANPDDLSEENLESLKNNGINRLSIGTQSFQNDILKFLNRAHNSSDALTSYRNARKKGFDNISIDLIYAIPGLDKQRWENDIEQIVALNPEHISCYSLTIEEKTAFGKWAATGKLKLVDDEIAALQLEVLMDKLEGNGYDHYEISNFSKPGKHSFHNSNYWKQEKYLGIGPSAHSYNKDIRQFNVPNNHLYIKKIAEGYVPAERETLTHENKINEFVLTSLRTHWGTDLSQINLEYGYDLLETNKAYIQQLNDEGLAKLEQNILILTRKGKLLADKIASDLFVIPA